MRKALLALMVLCFSFLFARAARAQNTFQVFGGYSCLRPPATVSETVICPVGILPPCPVTAIGTHSNLNGLELSGSYNAYKWLGATADFSGHYGSVQGPASICKSTYLVRRSAFPDRLRRLPTFCSAAPTKPSGEMPI